MKNYIFTFFDKKGNELLRKELFAHSKKDAITIANKLKAESNINDLNKVISKKH